MITIYYNRLEDHGYGILSSDRWSDGDGAYQYLFRAPSGNHILGNHYSLISIGSMWAIIHFKVKVGTALNSKAILADAGCTRACSMILSGVLLAASLIYELTGFGWADSLGSIFIAWLSFQEGREAFEKASGMGCRCCRA
jgi:divalent metal cation (Fe/Co/Zn/Cd) transporter